MASDPDDFRYEAYILSGEDIAESHQENHEDSFVDEPMFGRAEAGILAAMEDEDGRSNAAAAIEANITPRESGMELQSTMYSSSLPFGVRAPWSQPAAIEKFAGTGVLEQAKRRLDRIAMEAQDIEEPRSLKSPVVINDALTANPLPPPTTEDDALLDRYKTYVISIMPLNEQKKAYLRYLLDQSAWPTVWQSLRKIEDCKDSRNWDWIDVDDHLLHHLGKYFEMPWAMMADYLFIGMRPSQCKRRYEEVKEDIDVAEGRDVTDGRYGA